MTLVKTHIARRSFLKNVSLAGGGLVLGFSWLNSCTIKQSEKPKAIEMPKEWFEINAYLKIGDNGLVTIMSPNPEIGQNVKTSMPMLVADELDIDWENVIVEQAPLDTSAYSWQLAGGSQSIRSSWLNLRRAGATARHMLKEAAAKAWNVPFEEITTSAGIIHHIKTNASAGYGDMAAVAAEIPVPEEVVLKEVTDFKIINTSKKNVDGPKIVTGKPLYGIDVQEKGMLIAMIAHPPAFGLQLKDAAIETAKKMSGIKDVFKIKTFEDDYRMNAFDNSAFQDLVVVVGLTTWQVLQAKKALKLEWEKSPTKDITMDFFGWETHLHFPEGLENSEDHRKTLMEQSRVTQTLIRKDGDPEAAFKKAAKVIERDYSCPFLAHNCMEPMNFFAHVTEEKARLLGPVQTPSIMQRSVAERLGYPLEKVEIQMSRMGGGFGRRLYGHYLTEVAVISKKMKAPVKLVYSREDDMTMGIYRPAYHAYYRAALDNDNNLIAFQVRAGGIHENPLVLGQANRFPAGAVDNYLAEGWNLSSNVTIGAFRAPGSNFIAGAEQSFLDEIAEAAGKDPIEFRLELLNRAKEKPVGENNDYEPDRYADVLKMVKEKSSWNKTEPDVFRGMSAYYCHNSYVAQVLDVVKEKGKVSIKKVTSAIDCGIVVNPDAATNMAEGAVIDGIGHALYGEITLKDGVPGQKNFDRYRLIRHREAPQSIETHFVKNDIDPTGLGEPPYPPVIGALANALYKATGKRYYHQPFSKDNPSIS